MSVPKISQNLEAAWLVFKIATFALTFDRFLGSTAAEAPVIFQNDTIIQTINLVASRLHEVLR